MPNAFIPTLCFLFLSQLMMARNPPLKIAVISLTHAHVGWVFGSEARGDIEIVGIVEPDRELAERYHRSHGFGMENVYATMDDLFAAVTPEAVTAFGTIYDHLAVVEACAPRGIHVMVEKPLAVSVDHARKMKALAEEHGIHLLTNYETTWYPTNHKAHELVVERNEIGPIRKIVVRDGHRGPKKIGVGEEFLSWLTDPILNGGGALTDFGCYGANLLTWFHHGERPLSVTAVTQQQQAENNPKVEDEAIIVVKYPNSIGIIQASWNWPIGRKDMEVYGLTGAVFADNRYRLRMQTAIGYDDYSERPYTLGERPAPYDDPFAYLAAVIRGEVTVADHEPTALENNVLVVEILEAAKKSAGMNRTVKLE